MRQLARQHGIRNPIGVRHEKWQTKRQRVLEEERAKEGCNGGRKSRDAGLE
jgi:hypothetical protein